jgi:nucleoside-diphosphate-sugar epimerase
VADRFLVTGALGCIGAWTVNRLSVAGTEVVATDLGTDAHRWRLIDPGLEAAVPLISCDVTDAAGFASLVADQGITHIVHLAALQVPFARARPMLGARVNVEGMAVVLEAARQHRDQVRGLTFASSIAVYGPASAYPPGRLAHDAPPAPSTLYGAYKLADEWMARVYAAEHGVTSIGLRPSVVFGPGRDQGMTSTPTQAMLAAATGRPLHIDWGGSAGYHHARDVADAFIAAARAAEDGGPSDTYNLPVETRTMDDVVTSIRQAEPAAQITFERAPLPFPADFDSSEAMRRLGALHLTPFGQAVAETVATFRSAAAEGRLPALL